MIGESGVNFEGGGELLSETSSHEKTRRRHTRIFVCILGSKIDVEIGIGRRQVIARAAPERRPRGGANLRTVAKEKIPSGTQCVAQANVEFRFTSASSIGNWYVGKGYGGPVHHGDRLTERFRRPC